MDFFLIFVKQVNYKKKDETKSFFCFLLSFANIFCMIIQATSYCKLSVTNMTFEFLFFMSCFDVFIQCAFEISSKFTKQAFVWPHILMC